MPDNSYEPVGIAFGYVVYLNVDGKFVLWNMKKEKFLEGESDTPEAAVERAKQQGEDTNTYDDLQPWINAFDRVTPEGKSLWKKVKTFFRLGE